MRREGSHYNLPGGSGAPAQLEWLPATTTAGTTQSDPNAYVDSMVESPEATWTFTTSANWANQTIAGTQDGAAATRPARVDIPLLELLPTFSFFGQTNPSLGNFFFVRLSNLSISAALANNYRMGIAAGIHYLNLGVAASPGGSVAVWQGTTTVYTALLLSVGGVKTTTNQGATIPYWSVSETTFQPATDALATYATELRGYTRSRATGVSRLTGAATGDTGIPLDPALYFLRIMPLKASGGVAVPAGVTISAKVEYAWAPMPMYYP